MSNWKDVVGYEGKYMVSDNGQVKSLDKEVPSRHKTRKVSGKILALSDHSKGYKRISLRKNGLKKNLSIHRLVAMAFIPEIVGKDYVNHKNGIKNDNNASNLEWVTASENNIHAYNELGFNGRRGKLNKPRIIKALAAINGEH